MNRELFNEGLDLWIAYQKAKGQDKNKAWEAFDNWCIDKSVLECQRDAIIRVYSSF